MLYLAHELKKYSVILLLFGFVLLSALRYSDANKPYATFYSDSIDQLESEFQSLQIMVEAERDQGEILAQINLTRRALKRVDFWLRYSNPIAHKFLNGPLPIEWEVEVFEKWEAPYKREAAGLSLLEIAIEEGEEIDAWKLLVARAIDSIQPFQIDNHHRMVESPEAMLFANRLHLLNLATIYTTGFECPNPELVIPELEIMLASTLEGYELFNRDYPNFALPETYISEYKNMLDFVRAQSADPSLFDHFLFIKDHVNPLFALNQLHIKSLGLTSSNVSDYSLNNRATSIFDKSLYSAQESKGVFKGLSTQEDLDQLYQLGEQLFNDPILSINNKRSCASCHIPSQYFNDTSRRTSLQLDGKTALERNTPSLIGSLSNHLLMLDGKHINPSRQADEVVQNPMELGLGRGEIMTKVMAIPSYKKSFNKLAKKVISKNVSNEHIYSAITFYYSSLDTASSKLDKAMNEEAEISEDAKAGFNLFMSKAECATCHFAPTYNGIKPPYVSSEFEVLGTPEDTAYSALSSDKGRGKVHKVGEMENAFRTPTLRNLSRTKPYMHNGVFQTLDEVLEFYNSGGGVGNGLNVPNQTLNSEELDLSVLEIAQLKAFLLTLDEDIELPQSNPNLPPGRGPLKERQTVY